jgi:hypothetical protein
MADFKFWADFPNLDKAEGAKSITDLVRGLLKGKEHPIELVEEVQSERDRQRAIDFRSFAESIPVAVERGNDNACADRHQSASIENQQLETANAQYVDRVLPYSAPARLYGQGQNQTLLPKPVSTGGVRGGRRPAPATFAGNQLRATPKAQPLTVRTIATDAPADRGRVERFARAHAGQRGTAIGDRAIVFSPNGTPLVGDSVLERSRAENLSANQAAATPPITAIPSDVRSATTPIPAKALTRGSSGQVAPKNDAIAGGMALAIGAALISAVMFPLQYLISFFTFLLQVQTAATNIRNIASSMTTFMSNIGFLLGFGKDTLKPIEEISDGIMNNIFGKEKVDYVKLQFAKLSTVVTAGANILNAFEQGNNALAGAVEENARNNSKIGNALKASGLFVSEKFAWMNEKISAKQQQGGKLNDLNNALSVTGQVSTALTAVTTEIKTASEESAELERRAQEEKEKGKGDRKEESGQYEGEAQDVPQINRDTV